MSDVVLLSNTPTDLLSDVGRQFVIDATRAGEGLITDQELTEKYDLSPADWQNITKNSELGRAIRLERERRLLNGVAAREAACRHFVKAPGVLAGIMESAESNPRHVIEAAKEIRAVATAGGSDRPAQIENFIIRIDLTATPGGDVTEKTVTINATDGDSNVIPLEGKPDGNGQW